jgi:hypothetical protein
VLFMDFGGHRSCCQMQIITPTGFNMVQYRVPNSKYKQYTYAA